MSAAVPKTLPQGLRIQGKWTKQQWVIRSCLGVGANGTVYAVQRADGEFAAMKICPDAGSVAFEWGLLEKMNHVGSSFPVPQCIDDSETNSPLYFYVMELIAGRSLEDVWRTLSGAEQKRVLIDIVEGLRELHRSSHAFCDIKPQNILVDMNRTPTVRFVDVGGVTPFGRAVRQYTPTSDTAYWGFGERRASPAYDVAAVACMVICLEHPLQNGISGWSVEKRKQWMLQAVRSESAADWRNLFERVLTGRIADVESFLQVAAALSNKRQNASSTPNRRGKPNQNPARQTSGAHTRQVVSRKRDVSAVFMWYAIASACTSTAVAWAVYLRWL